MLLLVAISTFSVGLVSPPKSTAEPIVVHVVVLLADNLYQGIVPVRPPLGDGGDPGENLYWGAQYGFDTHFKKSGWRRIEAQPSKHESVLARSAFTRLIRGRPVVVVGEAWNGRHSRGFLERYLMLLSGDAKAETIKSENRTISVGPDADLVVYVGHNVLMDLTPPSLDHLKHRKIDTVLLGCQSEKYFRPMLDLIGSKPWVSTTSNMAPEAYTLEALIRAYARGESPARVRRAAAAAYARYQNISLRSASRVFAGAN
ncbi:MAG: hypothetical protein AAFQ65_12675 [Myxococcota bacterium]